MCLQLAVPCHKGQALKIQAVSRRDLPDRKKQPGRTSKAFTTGFSQWLAQETSDFTCCECADLSQISARNCLSCFTRSWGPQGKPPPPISAWSTAPGHSRPQTTCQRQFDWISDARLTGKDGSFHCSGTLKPQEPHSPTATSKLWWPCTEAPARATLLDLKGPHLLPE